MNASILETEEQLTMAIRDGNLQLVECLLKNGVKLQSTDLYVLSIVYRHLFQETAIRKDLLRLFANYGLIDRYFCDKYGRNLLHLFIDQIQKTDTDLVEIAKILIDVGISINDVDEEGCSPLLGAIAKNNVELIKFLISEGADISSVNNLKDSPLRLAVRYNSVEIVNLLISKGADVNARNVNGWTAFHSACLRRDESMISFLLQNGAAFCCKTKGGLTPLYLIFSNGSTGDYEKCLIRMMKEFSKLNFEKEPVFYSDVELVQQNRNASKHYELCSNELKMMASMKFHGPYTYYSILKKSLGMKKLAPLTKNNEIVEKFEAEVGTFSYYGKDLKCILEEAVKIKDETEVIYSTLMTIFGNFLPDIVVRKLTDNFTLKDLRM